MLFSLIGIVLGVALGIAVQAVHEAPLAEFGRGYLEMTGYGERIRIG
jgi:putative ABC transport system permease protein